MQSSFIQGGTSKVSFCKDVLDFYHFLSFFFFLSPCLVLEVKILFISGLLRWCHSSVSAADGLWWGAQWHQMCCSFIFWDKADISLAQLTLRPLSHCTTASLWKYKSFTLWESRKKTPSKTGRPCWCMEVEHEFHYISNNSEAVDSLCCCCCLASVDNEHLWLDISVTWRYRNTAALLSLLTGLTVVCDSSSIKVTKEPSNK